MTPSKALDEMDGIKSPLKVEQLALTAGGPGGWQGYTAVCMGGYQGKEDENTKYVISSTLPR